MSLFLLIQPVYDSIKRQKRKKNNKCKKRLIALYL